MRVEPTTLTIKTGPNGQGFLVTMDTLMANEQRLLVSMNVPLTDAVPLVSLKIAAYEAAQKAISDNLELLRKQLPADQPSQQLGN